MNQFKVFFITKSKSNFAKAYKHNSTAERLFDSYEEGIRESLHDSQEQTYELINIDQKEEIQNLPSTTLLLIEDQSAQIALFIDQLKENKLFSKAIVCDKRETAHELLELIPKEAAPKIIGLDFSLNLSDLTVDEAKLTKNLYVAIKSKWKGSIVIGISNHEENENAKFITDEMRKNGDSAYDKYAIEKAISAIVKDKLAILDFMSFNTKLINHVKKSVAEDKLLAEEAYLSIFDFICRYINRKTETSISSLEISRYMKSIESMIPTEIQNKFSNTQFTFGKFGSRHNTQIRKDSAKQIAVFFEEWKEFDQEQKPNATNNVTNLVASHFGNYDEHNENHSAAIILLNKPENKDRWKTFRTHFNDIDKL